MGCWIQPEDFRFSAGMAIETMKWDSSRALMRDRMTAVNISVAVLLKNTKNPNE